MKNYSLLLLLLWVAFLSYTHAQSHDVFIDFGGASSTSPWHNVASATSGSIEELVTTNGIPTGIRLEVSDRFGGTNTNGTAMPDAALNIPGSASGDSFYGNDIEFGGGVQPTGGVRLSDLDTAIAYTLTVFASRLANDNRETKYVVQGKYRDSALLQVANNTDQVVTFTLFPDQEGEIELIAMPGPNNNNSYGFFYLGAMKLSFMDSIVYTSDLQVQQPAGGEYWQVGKTVEIRWQNLPFHPSEISYSINNGQDWLAIDTLPAFASTYSWNIPNMPSTACLIRITSDTMVSVSPETFTIAANDDICRVVVLGSSTAAGAVVTKWDSAWVNRFRAHITPNDTRVEVINLARGGYTTYHLLPTGNMLGEEVNIDVDTARNITKALSFNPNAVIINLPSNDASRGIGLDIQMRNFKIMTDAALSESVKAFVCTTQPTSTGDSVRVMLQRAVRDSIFSFYGNYAIDFWSEIALPDGSINPVYGSGDGTHLNDAGHRILFQRALGAVYSDTLCDAGYVGISAPTVDEFDVTIYPNPIVSNLFIAIDNIPIDSSPLRVRLYNAMGQEIFKQEFANHPASMLVEIPSHIVARGGAMSYVVVEKRTKNNFMRYAQPVLLIE